MEPEDDRGSIDLVADFKAYQERITSSLVDVTRTAGQISTQDLSFHRSSSDKLSRSLDSRNAHLLRLTNKLLKAATKDTSLKAPSLRSQDDIDDSWRGIVDVIDDLLEKADASLDEFTGVMRRMSPALQNGAQTPPVQARQNISNGFAHASMPKPQIHFERKVNNFETKPFRPLLRNKPHAIVPLEESLDGLKNPYHSEIEQSTYPPEVYEHATPISYSPPQNSQPVWVDTEEVMQVMLEELKQAKEIAIDLEHNEKKSYMGIVCLMQISTREKDWLIDALKPWRENLQVLNEVFADPRILKVFHGASMDIIWLQRDLGLYVVNLFDTYHASVALNFPGKGLKHLLLHFCNFEAQKQYQLADWRIRPLPTELLDYARSDTHYLLYIYDNLRNSLLERSTPMENLIDKVRDESKREALQIYERPVYDRETGTGPLGWYGALVQRTITFDNQQFAVFRAVHEWRDKKAREWDEGITSVMPNNAVWSIAENMPIHHGAFHMIVRPLPRAIAEYARELAEIVKTAKFEGHNGPTIGEIIQKNSLKYGFPNRRWQKKADGPNSQYSGLGAVLEQLHQSGEMTNSPAVNHQTQDNPDEPLVVRTAQSSFWGGISTTFPTISSEATAASSALQTILPLPFLSTDSVTESANTIAELAPERPSHPTQESLRVKDASESNNHETFILKDLSRKRKATARDANLLDDDSTEANTEQGLTGSVAHEIRAAQLEAKAIKKAAKKAKKGADAQAAMAQMTVPFDYASAESLLTPQLGASNAKPNGINGKPIMNPYAKALDTKTGAKQNKLGKELAGRSKTFQS